MGGIFNGLVSNKNQRKWRPKKRRNLSDYIITVLNVNKAKSCQPPSQTEKSLQNTKPPPSKDESSCFKETSYHNQKINKETIKDQLGEGKTQG